MDIQKLITKFPWTFIGTLLMNVITLTTLTYVTLSNGHSFNRVLEILPTALPGVNTDILDPRDTYEDAAQWQTKAQDLASRFVNNFNKFTDTENGKALVKAGPII